IPAGHVTKDMLDLARHIVETKKGHFDPAKFEDHYERALHALIEKKRKGETIAPPRVERPAKVINLMDALRRSVAAEGKRPAAGAVARHRRTTAKHPAAASKRPRARKAG